MGDPVPLTSPRTEPKENGTNTMKRFLICAVLLGIVAPIGLSGCGEETKAPETPKTEAPSEPAKTP
jgi:hypothetical protein